MVNVSVVMVVAPGVGAGITLPAGIGRLDTVYVGRNRGQKVFHRADIVLLVDRVPASGWGALGEGPAERISVWGEAPVHAVGNLLAGEGVRVARYERVGDAVAGFHRVTSVAILTARDTADSNSLMGSDCE